MSAGLCSYGIRDVSAKVALIGQAIAAIIEIVEQVNGWSGGNHGSLPAPLDDSTNFWDVFPGEMIDKLVAEGIEAHLGPAFDILRLFGVADIKHATPGALARVPYDRISLDWGQLGEMVTNPLEALKQAIGWDKLGQDLKHRRLLEILESMFFAADFATRQQSPAPAMLDLYYSAGNAAWLTAPALAEN